MNPITTSVWIDAVPEEVFAVATSFGGCAEWLSGVKEASVLTAGPVGVGTRFRETRIMGGREATEGLAPLIRAEIWECLMRLKTTGQSILVIDKNVEALTRIADRHYLIERGRVVWTGTSHELAAAPDVQHRYLGI